MQTVRIKLQSGLLSFFLAAFLMVSIQPVQAADALLSPLVHNPLVQGVGLVLADGVTRFVTGGAGLGERIGAMAGGCFEAFATPAARGLWQIGLPLITFYVAKKFTDQGMPLLLSRHTDSMPAEFAAALDTELDTPKTSFEGWKSFFYQHKTKIIITSAVVVALAVLYWGYPRFSQAGTSAPVVENQLPSPDDATPPMGEALGPRTHPLVKAELPVVLPAELPVELPVEGTTGVLATSQISSDPVRELDIPADSAHPPLADLAGTIGAVAPHQPTSFPNPLAGQGLIRPAEISNYGMFSAIVGEQPVPEAPEAAGPASGAVTASGDRPFVWPWWSSNPLPQVQSPVHPGLAGFVVPPVIPRAPRLIHPVIRSPIGMGLPGGLRGVRTVVRALRR